MYIRLSILSLTIIFLLFSCENKNQENTVKKSQPPNVLFIAVDDLNDWLGCMNGHPNTNTPNIDKLAAEGVLFTNAHCQAPLCGPSRASLMTGLRPSTTGIYGMIGDNKIKSDNPATENTIFLPEYFKEHGYYTMGIGTSDPEKYGRTSTDWGAFPEADSLMPDHHSANWTIERLNRDYDQPFSLAVGFLRPHVPWYVPQKWFNLHPVENLEMTPYKEDDLDDVPAIAHQINDLPMLPTTEWAIENNQWKNIIQAYLVCVSFVDYEVGRVLDALEKSNYADNTIIVLWSDHGYRLGEKGTFAKHALWEGATNAPLIFAGSNLPKGKVIDEPAEMLSIYPTLLDLCGLPAYERNEGINLVPLMKKEVPEKNERFAITTYGMNNHGLRTSVYRYIHYEDGGEELYNHNTDPNEWTNLAGKPEYSAVKNNLKVLLPEINKNWNVHSEYTLQPYFVEQKARTSN